MKKKLRGETRHFASVKLYRSDLDEVIAIMKSISEDIQISDNEFDYDSMTDLETRRGQYITDLELSIVSPRFSVALAGEAKLARGHELETLTPYVQVENVFRRRKRLFLALVLNPFVGVLVFLAHMIALINIIPRLPTNLLVVFMCVVLYVAILFCLVLLFYVQRLGWFSRVLLVDQHQEQSFWKRNRDTLVVSIIVGVSVAVITWAITYFTTK